jgi:hypothetical protein
MPAPAKRYLVPESMRHHDVPSEVVAMWRSISLAVVALAANCAPVQPTTTMQASSTPSAASAQYEPAPVVTPLNFNMPPDLRDKICNNAFDPDATYVALSRPVNSFCQ